ncbi:TetR/AcrR family transcriptional regulator [uncultured Tissierella sp.]|uniref:TetR/AcrR family transcriptional regulator n=1 Tax=uncultured Tissierella sp. TaxID=448160 RepID=UPI0028050C54|nr:TetR/AcrR family transcriptional regulator [uncultured Tissierella sp.]MDU5080504.1 TetR/AcrR family transcriptional regulator [Bacillota bacterium]
MEEKNTKQVIFENALNLFAIHGYEGVSVAQIADSVNIKAPSLYKHYKSKQEIFDTILCEVSNRMNEARNRLTIPADSEMVDKYENIDLNVLGKMCYALLSFYLNDEVVSKFRKMLTIERYHNTEAEKLFQKIFIDDVLELETNLFRELIQRGHFIDSDPYIMALNFYSPLFLLLYKFDNSDYKPESLQYLINQLVYSFSERYIKKEKKIDD